MPCHNIQEHEDYELDQETKGKKGKKRTRMHNVYDRLGIVPPIRVEYNEDGQSVGDNASEFSNFISTLVKSKISLRHTDWRKVEVEQKIKFWTTLKMYYVVDDKLKDWVMGSAAKKWRDFKSELKTLYFDDKTNEELQVVPDNRVSPKDWEELVGFWRSEVGKKCSQQGKQNQKEMELLHTSGSKSHARLSHEMHKNNGYPPHRHEVFMETHKCKKTGAPSNVAVANMFKKIEAMENERPELLEKTIKQGDLFSHVTGNERNGYVRCIGLGPSAADLGMPGTRKLKSTKLQMAEEDAKEARQANAILHERVDQIESGFQSVVASLKDEFLQMKRLLLQSNVRQNVEFSLRHDLSQNWIDADEDGYEGAYGSRHEDSVGSATANLEVRREKEATILQKKTEGALLQKKALTFTQKNIVQSAPAQHEVLQEKGAAISQNKKATMQQDKDVTLQRNKMATSLRKEVPFTQKNYQQGRDVILYSVYRDHGSPVAKATILSIDRREVDNNGASSRAMYRMAIQAFGSGQVNGKCSNATTRKLRRFPKIHNKLEVSKSTSS